MSAVLRSAYQLVDEILDQGLPFVASYMEKKIHRPVIITDEKGLIHYPADLGSENVYELIPGQGAMPGYFYQESDGSLFYPVEYSGTTAWVIVQSVPAKLVVNVLALLAEARLAIKCYFSNLKRNDQDQTDLENKLVSYLFSSDQKNIIKTICLENWDYNAPCYVVVLRADQENEVVSWKDVYRFSQNYFRKARIEAIPLLGPDCFIVIWPARFIHEAGSDDPELPRLTRYQTSLKNNINFNYSAGIGRIYPLFDLKRSFHEARIALTLPYLVGQRDFSQYFSELGFLAHIFAADKESLKEYSLKTLGKVLEYDNSNHGELIPTLRQLLNSSFNCRAAADNLFIHINTLYYRINKIEELLGVNLSQMNTRVNLYTAILVWDTLKETGQIE